MKNLWINRSIKRHLIILEETRAVSKNIPVLDSTIEIWERRLKARINDTKQEKLKRDLLLMESWKD